MNAQEIKALILDSSEYKSKNPIATMYDTGLLGVKANDNTGNVANATSTDATASNYAANMQALNPDALAQNQINNFIDPNNAVNRQIVRGMKGQFNSRGLLNSTMQDEATQQAIIANAVDLGKFDAAQISARGDLNLGYLNDSSKTNALNQTDISKTNAAAQTDVSKANAAATNTQGLQDTAAQNQMDLSYASDVNKSESIKLEGSIQQALTDSQLKSNQLVAAMNNAASVKSSEISAGATKSAAQSKANADAAIAKANNDAKLANTALAGEYDKFISNQNFEQNKVTKDILSGVTAAETATAAQTNLQSQYLAELGTVLKIANGDMSVANPMITSLNNGYMTSSIKDLLIDPTTGQMVIGGGDPTTVGPMPVGTATGATLNA